MRQTCIQRQSLFGLFNTVTAGNLAVTVNYSDGTEIQLLPAIRTSSGGVRIAEPGSTRWSNVVRPEVFAEELSAVNQANHGRVTPTIKLAKAMADCFITRQAGRLADTTWRPSQSTLSGTMEARLSTRGPCWIHLLGHSMTAVMRPIADSTGQSTHVDSSLGPADSGPRKRASTYFGQMRGNVRRCNTRAQFNALFCL